LALHSHWLGSLLVTLYFSWSPWHFAGQNYGLGLMFLRRRQVEVPPDAKRALYLAFVISVVLTLLVFHTRESSSSFAPDFSSTSREYEILRLGFPPGLAIALAPLLTAAYLGALAWAGLRLRRAGAGPRDLAIVGLLALTHTLWFSLPAYAAATGHPIENVAFSAVWASIAHSVQYLWVTSYYARRAGTDPQLLPYYAKALLAGCLIAVVPGLVVAPLAFGPLSWIDGLAILVFAMINLHHFVLDGAIWKLRDGRVARLLLRTDGTPGSPTGSAPPRARALVWIAGLVCLGMLLVELWDAQAARSLDPGRLEAAARRLAWIGRERLSVLSPLAGIYAERGDVEAAERIYRHGLFLKRDRLFGANDYNALDTLAVSFAAAGRYADARRVGARALTLARKQEADLVRELASRLALYERGRPYRGE
jgi:hypothetical protein